MRRTIVQAAAGAAMVVALVAGCGSGDSNGSSDTNGGAAATSGSEKGADASESADASEGAGAAEDGADSSEGAGAGASEGAGGAGGGDAAAKVSAAIEQAMGSAPVTFAPESAELSDSAKQTLKTIADAMQGNDVTLVVDTSAGYPDAAKAKALSEQRAKAIVAAFEEYGVTADRITTNATGNENAKGEQALQTQITVG